MYISYRISVEIRKWRGLKIYSAICRLSIMKHLSSICTCANNLTGHLHFGGLSEKLKSFLPQPNLILLEIKASFACKTDWLNLLSLD